MPGLKVLSEDFKYFRYGEVERIAKLTLRPRIASYLAITRGISLGHIASCIIPKRARGCDKKRASGGGNARWNFGCAGSFSGRERGRFFYHLIFWLLFYQEKSNKPSRRRLSRTDVNAVQVFSKSTEACTHQQTKNPCQ
jgi:hypothetical protein